MEISIIIPTKNRLDKLKKTITYLEKQSFRNFELVIVNDGGVDINMGKNLLNVKVFKSQMRGPAYARNIGIKNSSGNILIFLGDDTYPKNNFVEEHYRFHQKNPQKNYAMIGYIKWYKKLGTKPIYRFLNTGVQFDFLSLTEGKQTDCFHFYTSNLSIKKDFIELFDEEIQLPFYDDTELAFRLKHKNLVLIYNPEAVVEHDHYFDERLLIDRAIKTGYTYKILEKKGMFKKHKFKLTAKDKFKLIALTALKFLNIYKLKYYHYVYVSNFLKGYEKNIMPDSSA